MEVSVRELKNRLSHYLRRVQAGDSIEVTDRGRPVAEIHPVRREALSPEERLARLAELGEVTLARPGGFEDVEPLKRRGRPVAETLLADRE
jgi:prevent-host-death family protein